MMSQIKISVDEICTLVLPKEYKYFSNPILKLPENMSISDITLVIVQIGGMEFDRIYGSVNLEILYKKFNEEFDLSSKFIKILCCPFNKDNLVPNGGIKYPTKIMLEYKNGDKLIRGIPQGCEFYCDIHTDACDDFKTSEFLTLQSQINQELVFSKHHKLALNFNHVGDTMYVYSKDMENRLSNVELIKNGELFECTKYEKNHIVVFDLKNENLNENSFRLDFDWDEQKGIVSVLLLNHNICKRSGYLTGLAYF
jgi:hypothetical protein